MFLVGINSFLYGLKIKFIPYAARSAAARFIALPLILITILFYFVFNRVQSNLSHTECCWNQSFFVHQPTAGRTGGLSTTAKSLKKSVKRRDIFHTGEESHQHYFLHRRQWVFDRFHNMKSEIVQWVHKSIRRTVPLKESGKITIFQTQLFFSLFILDIGSLNGKSGTQT